LKDVIHDTKVFNQLPKGIRTALQYSTKIVESIQREEIDEIAAATSRILKGFEVHITGS
jgi:hypothetical protein